MNDRSRPLGPDDLGTALAARGYRLTRQRREVYDYLASVTSHPTAEAVYSGVKREVPNISLATVYKALDSLVASGVAQRLGYGDGSAHYDARVDEHQHARCIVCGKVCDMSAPERGTNFIDRLGIPDGFTPTDVRVEILGTCADCL
jgi:Fe2+ or Zn2+ uptake regulation protein